MATSVLADALRNALHEIDPRRSLMAAIVWLVATLAAGFAAAASYWAGSAAEEIVVQQHVRRLALETEQYASDLAQAVNERLDALRVSAGTPAADLFARLSATLPDLNWLLVADAHGRIVGASSSSGLGGDARGSAWFLGGSKAPWLGRIAASEAAATPELGQMAAPVRDANGNLVAVVAASLSWHWALTDVSHLSHSLNPRGSAQTLVLDRDGVVLIGPDELRNTQWRGVALDVPPPLEGAARGGNVPRFERTGTGPIALVARAHVALLGTPDLNWQVQLSEPKDDVYQRANALRTRILWISVALAALTGLAGALVARHLTSRLRRLTRSASAVGRGEGESIEVPPGLDEVTQLGSAFSAVLEVLQRERRELLKLSEALEQRVAERTSEVERLAEESRYAAVVRERLKMARDLHDTLAHSMMAMLAEVRLLRRLQATQPQALAAELQHAEDVAHAGLNEAREAIARMRVNSARDTGLGAALKLALERFIDRTGIRGEFRADATVAGFGDERAETLLRMAEEALRNVEKHANASCVKVALGAPESGTLEMSISDDGIGFDQSLPRPGHYGLVGLKEQAQLIGAELTIDSGPDAGTRLRVRL